jgi:hypothetical protein
MAGYNNQPIDDTYSIPFFVTWNIFRWEGKNNITTDTSHPLFVPSSFQNQPNNKSGYDKTIPYLWNLKLFNITKNNVWEKKHPSLKSII